MEYRFRVILTQPTVTDEEVDRLVECGCDDGTVTTRNGQTSLLFDRDSQSLQEAMISATRDIRSAGLQVLRIELEATALDAAAAG